MKNTAKPASSKPLTPPSKLSLWLPNIIAIAVFALVAIIYFFPALKGMVLNQSDITQFLGSSKEIVDFRAKYHTEPLWTNSMFGGMPAYAISTEYPSNLVHYLFTALLKWLPFPCAFFFLFCIGFYILLRVLDVNAWLSIVGSLAYGFSSYFFIILAVGHNSKAAAIGFMAPVLAGVILAFKGKRLQGAVLTALALALELFSDHPQITYYLFIMVAIYGLLELVKAFKEKVLPAYFKTLGVLLIAAGIAVGTDITNLWLTYDYGKVSTRGKSDLTLGGENKTAGLTVNYATQWSYGIPETFSMIIPNYQGGGDPYTKKEQQMWSAAVKDVDPQMQDNVSSFGPYWGDQPGTSGPIYVGAIICFFAFLGLFIIKGPLKWFVFFSTILAVMLSWGSNFMSLTDFFFQYFPGYNKFRSVSMILVMAELALPLLAVLAMDKIFKDKKFLEEKIPVLFNKKGVSGQNLFFGSLIIVGGFTVLAFIMPTTFTSMEKTNEVNQKLEEIQQQAGQKMPEGEIKQYRETIEQLMPSVIQARKHIFTADAARSSIFIILAALLAWLYMKKIVDWKWYVAVMGVFILADMFPLDQRYLNEENFKTKKPVSDEFQPDAADAEILKDTTLDYRVINTTVRPDQDGMTSYFHKSLGGYNGAKMKRYDEIMGSIEEEFRGIYQALQGQPAYLGVLNMLNTKYAIVEVKGGQKVAVPVPGACGNAWFVDNYRKVDNADSEILSLDNFTPATTAIVNKNFGDYLKISPAMPHDSTAVIKMTSYEPNDLNYVSHSKVERLAVFSEIYYKQQGWQAYIDGEPADHIQVDFLLRGMLIPAGNHKIEFKFHPSHYFIGEKISLASSLVLFGGCIGFLFMQFRKKNEAA